MHSTNSALRDTSCLLRNMTVAQARYRMHAFVFWQACWGTWSGGHRQTCRLGCVPGVPLRKL
jgi:hypothetical protein